MASVLLARFPARTRQAARVRFIFGQEVAEPGAPLAEEAESEIRAVLGRGLLQAEVGSVLRIPTLPGNESSEVVLLQCGETLPLTAAECQKLWRALAELEQNTIRTLQLDWPDQLAVEDRSVAWAVRQLVLCLREQDYRFDLHPKKRAAEKGASRVLQIVGLKENKRVLSRVIEEAHAIADGIDRARDLGNLAPNLCTPIFLAEQARKLARGNDKLSVKVLDEKAMDKAGMGALLAVARGSANPPRLIAMEYKGGKAAEAPIVLVGKGITFDTGGISIKPSAAMDEMKYDMCGAASVFGVIEAALAMQLKRNVVGIVVAAENMPDGNACRPGDVVTTMSGQSVEILNTDAEGRLVLCDALHWAARYKPDVVIDIATLTGACIVALGHVASAVIGNDPMLVDSLVETGEHCGDRTWALPLWDEYQRQLDSNFADIANIGGPAAGTITAACFLSRFTEDYRWAHLDIAGVAWKSGKDKAATGRPVSLLMHWLNDANP